MNSIKLTLKDWALVSLSVISGVLLIIIRYKNEQLHAAQVSLLRAIYANKSDLINAKQKVLSATAKAASGAYSAERARYVEQHGGKT